jgi:hypothetical protein
VVVGRLSRGHGPPRPASPGPSWRWWPRSWGRALVGNRDPDQGRQARRRIDPRPIALLVGLGNALGRGTSGTAQILLLPAAAAFAIPAAVWATEALPAVESESASPGLGHRGLLGHEP